MFAQWVLGAGRLSSLAVGGGAGGWLAILWGGRSFSETLLVLGGHFYKFYESSKQAVTIKRKLIECRSHE